MTHINPELIKKKADKYRERTAQVLSDMIKIPSICGREEAMVRFLENEFANCGAHEISIDNFGNIMARLGSRGPVIAFDAHLDTVDIGQREQWSLDPFSGEIGKGRVHGRGAVDQKAGMASMLTAMRIISELSSDLPFTLFFIGSVMEEDCDGLCWQYIVKEDKIVPDIVILTEPTDGQINRGHRGRMEMEIIVGGVSCHGGMPEKGQNAIYKLAPILSAIEKLNERLPSDPILGKGSLAATKIRSSAPSLNAIPDQACIYLDRRLTVGEDSFWALKQIEFLEEARAAKATVSIPVFDNPSWRGTTYPTRKIFPSWILDGEHHLIDYARRCFSRLFSSKPKIGHWSFSTNGAATMGLLKIPTFGFGPGDERMAHSPNESVAIEELVRCAAFYAYFPWLVTGP